MHLTQLPRSSSVLRVWWSLKKNRSLRVHLKPDGTPWRTVGEVKGKLANGVGSQYSHATSEHGVSSITTADAHNSAASSRLNWRPRRFKRTHPFPRRTKSGFCACVITFQTQSNIGVKCYIYIYIYIYIYLCVCVCVFVCAHACVEEIK